MVAVARTTRGRDMANADFVRAIENKVRTLA